jgi:hypothetical protein
MDYRVYRFLFVGGGRGRGVDKYIQAIHIARPFVSLFFFLSPALFCPICSPFSFCSFLFLWFLPWIKSCITISKSSFLLFSYYFALFPFCVGPYSAQVSLIFGGVSACVLRSCEKRRRVGGVV